MYFKYDGSRFGPHTQFTKSWLVDMSQPITTTNPTEAVRDRQTVESEVHARDYLSDFFSWHNDDHYHSGLALFTPAAVLRQHAR